MSAPISDPLSQGTHTIEVEGVAQRYHVHGTGPLCVTHSGGPGMFWEYLAVGHVGRDELAPRHRVDPRHLPQSMIDTRRNPEIIAVDQDPLAVQGCARGW